MALLNLVVSKLQGESLTHYQKIWNKWDDDNSGVLNQGEFMQMMLSPEIGMDRRSALDLYDLADLDGSGGVDFNEFVAVMWDPDQLKVDELEEHIKGVFYSLSGDDASIESHELREAFPADMDSSEISQLFNEIDADGDGSITFDEFNAFLSSM